MPIAAVLVNCVLAETQPYSIIIVDLVVQIYNTQEEM
jgi:hypothetical protein